MLEEVGPRTALLGISIRQIVRLSLSEGFRAKSSSAVRRSPFSGYGSAREREASGYSQFVAT